MEVKVVATGITWRGTQCLRFQNLGTVETK